MYRQSLLPFVISLQDHDILIAIGEADEVSAPLGYKQLSLLCLATPTTLQRRLKALQKSQLIKKTILRDDRRRVCYSLSRHTLEAYTRYMSQLFAE